MTPMRIVLVGHGKMGQLVGELAGQYGCEVAGVIDPASPRHGGGPDDAINKQALDKVFEYLGRYFPPGK